MPVFSEEEGVSRRGMLRGRFDALPQQWRRGRLSRVVEASPQQWKQMKVAAAMLQIRLLRQMTSSDVTGMPPATAAPLRDCSETYAGGGDATVTGCMGPTFRWK
jgi:hypothetical protein